MHPEASDVAVIGGGPAGCAAALTLRACFPALSVVLLEAGSYCGYRPGEILPPAARSLLRTLGILHLLDQELAMPSRGIASAWGSTTLEQNDYFLSAHGNGWHLDRSRFDAMLAEVCTPRGVRVLYDTPLRGAVRQNGWWELETSRGLHMARFVIDATGRAAAFARMAGERIGFDDRLTSYSRIFANTDRCAVETLIESVPQGWWYTAPLPQGRRMVTFMTDVDLGQELRLPEAEAWRALLQETTHTAAVIGRSHAISDCLVRPASTARLSRIVGDGWLATGDAASAFDPLAAQGITKALRNGILAAYATGDLLRGVPGGADRYSAIVVSQFAGYRRAHRAHFARETRWSGALFWMRRQASSPLHNAGVVS